MAAVTRGERLALGVALATIGGLALSRLLFPYDLGHYEAGIWEPARILVAGGNPYGYPLTTAPPYVMAPYGPLYYALVGVGLRLFGPQLWFGRLLATVAMLATAGFVAVLARRFAVRPAAGPLAAAAFLAQPAVQFWTAAHRPDALALALAFGGIVLATTPRPPAGAAAWAAVAVAAAILTRQTLVLPPLVIVAWYLATGQTRRALVFAALTTGLLGLVMAAFEATSAGGFWWQQFVLPAAVPLGLAQMQTGLRTLAAAPATWIVVGIALATLLGARRPDETRTVSAGRLLLVGYATLAVALALVTSARAGSNVNYWLEASAATTLAAVVYGAWMRRSARWPSALGIALAFAALVGARGLVDAERARWRARPYLDAVVTRVRDVPPSSAPILSLYPELAVYAGREAWFGDPFQYDGRSPPHRALMIATMHSGVFAAIVLPFDRAPQGYERMPGLPPPPAGTDVFVFTRQ